MSLETKTTCPLGHKCEKIAQSEDGNSYIERCAWYVEVQGKHPQTDETLNESRCAMAWQPVLILEQSRNIHINTNAMLSMRNETVKRQDEALEALKNAEKNNVKSICK